MGQRLRIGDVIDPRELTPEQREAFIEAFEKQIDSSAEWLATDRLPRRLWDRWVVGIGIVARRGGAKDLGPSGRGGHS